MNLQCAYCYRIWYVLIILIGGIMVVSCSTSEEAVLEAFKNSDATGKTQLSKTSEFIIIIPDTQIYAANEENRKLLALLMDRIIEIDKAGFDIKMVLQVGDITDFNSEEEWRAVSEIFSKLDGLADYVLCTGNHDYGDGGTANKRETFFSDYFNYQESDSFVESFGEEIFENSYFQFEIMGSKFQLFSLEFAPRDSVVEWARGIAERNAVMSGLVLTHAYLSEEGDRYDFSKYNMYQVNTPYAWALNHWDFGLGNINDGQQLWDKLVDGNNMKFVFSGHINASKNLVSKDRNNQEVLQMVFAEHALPQAIEGWMQLLEFMEDGKTVRVRTYSALLNNWETAASYEFSYK